MYNRYDYVRINGRGRVTHRPSLASGLPAIDVGELISLLYASGRFRYLIMMRLAPSSARSKRTSSIKARMICKPRPRFCAAGAGDIEGVDAKPAPKVLPLFDTLIISRSPSIANR